MCNFYLKKKVYIIIRYALNDFKNLCITKLITVTCVNVLPTIFVYNIKI